jgi:hypothetical protein
MGNKYYLLLIDDLSWYMWVAAIISNDCGAIAIKEIQAWAEGESNTDRGGEFTTTEFTEYCTTEGVHHQDTSFYNL